MTESMTEEKAKKILSILKKKYFDETGHEVIIIKSGTVACYESDFYIFSVQHLDEVYRSFDDTIIDVSEFKGG